MLLVAALTGCGSTGTPSGTTAEPLGSPALRTPRTEVPIRQNDPATDCPFSATHGYGFQVPFSWSPVTGAVTYHLRMQHRGSLYPALDIVVGDTAFLMLECNAYVIDANLRDWRWSVAAVSAEGDEGPSAEERTYEFEPIVLPPQP
jgi:hypothetical protein